jgi:hypothetical protein
MSAKGQKRTYCLLFDHLVSASKTVIADSLENKKTPASFAGVSGISNAGGSAVEYAPEKLSKSPAGASRALLRSRCLRDRSIGGDGEIAAYANDRCRHIFGPIALCLLFLSECMVPGVVIVVSALLDA